MSLNPNPTAVHPAGWPLDLLPVFERFKTVEFTSVTRSGQPITYPLTPYVSDDGTALEVSTGLTYPAKAERVRHSPKVSLLFSEPKGSGLTEPPLILVLGHASVQSAQLQANTDRFIRRSIAKNPEANRNMSPGLVSRLGWYFVRLNIAIVPQEIYWWPYGQGDLAPQHWHAPDTVPLPPSDPAPTGTPPPPWGKLPQAWRRHAAYAVRHLGLPVVTQINAQGYPVSTRVTAQHLTADGFVLALPHGAIMPPAGKACLTFHTHSEQFLSQENLAFIGEATRTDTTMTFHVTRQLGNWSLRGGGLRAAWDFLSKGRVLNKRLAQEAARYGQSVPIVKLPS